MKDFINKINNKEDLTLNEMQEVINSIMSGMSDDDDIESFLIGLNEKGVSETEVTAAATVMKEKSLKFDIGDGSHIDTCGTGGTGLNTFNCSTASSFVAAVEELAATYESPEEVVKWYYSNEEQLKGIESSVIEDKVFDFIIEQAEVSDKEVSYQDVIKPESQGGDADEPA